MVSVDATKVHINHKILQKIAKIYKICVPLPFPLCR